jgi:hypothetical protein
MRVAVDAPLGPTTTWRPTRVLLHRRRSPALLRAGARIDRLPVGRGFPFDPTRLDQPQRQSRPERRAPAYEKVGERIAPARARARGGRHAESPADVASTLNEHNRGAQSPTVQGPSDSWT